MHYSVVELHGALTHFPIAMLIAAALFEIGAPIFRKSEWRVVSFWMLVTAVAGFVPSLITGWLTGNQFFGHVAAPPSIFLLHRLAAFVSAGLALLLLVWRIVAKDKMPAGAMAASVVLVLVAAGGVSYTGYLGGLMVFGGGTPDAASSSPAPRSVSSTTSTAVDSQLVTAGKLLFQQNGCADCHRINGQGMQSGPDLSNEGARNGDIAWQIAHLKDPTKIHPNSFMPSFASLGEAKLKALANYLVSLKS
jgi:mono/diheme cytochrome c family protein